MKYWLGTKSHQEKGTVTMEDEIIEVTEEQTEEANELSQLKEQNEQLSNEISELKKELSELRNLPRFSAGTTKSGGDAFAAVKGIFRKR